MKYGNEKAAYDPAVDTPCIYEIHRAALLLFFKWLNSEGVDTFKYCEARPKSISDFSTGQLFFFDVTQAILTLYPSSI